MKANKPHPYIDNIFHGKETDFDSHLIILDEIFQQLKEAEMQVNLGKSMLCTKQVKSLRFCLKQTGF